MTMEATNQEILKQLQKHAQKYFAAIIEVNSSNGECNLKPGRYTAKDLTNRSYKGPLGCYAIPQGEEFEGDVTVSAGTFTGRFPYRHIFSILTDWESMCKAGKLKTVFEVGNVEEKKAKVLINDRDALGNFKTKTMTLQRIGGNWYGLPKEIRKEDAIGYYELKGVMFAPGKRFWGKVWDESNKRFTEKFDDAEITKILISYLANHSDNVGTPYFAEVARLAGIDIESEEAKTIADAAKEEQRKREEERQREEAEERERRRMREEADRKRIEEEERQAAESLAKAKECFISGKIISCNDFERIADSVGYEINIRTLGTLRKRITWIEVSNDGTPTVYGTKKRAGLDGTFTAIREVYELVKAKAGEAEPQSKEPPRPHESIPMESYAPALPKRVHTPPEIANRSVCKLESPIGIMRLHGAGRHLLAGRSNAYYLVIAPPGYVWPIRGS